MANPSLDFKAIKSRVSMLDALTFLLGDFKKPDDVDDMRLPCPACSFSNNRALAISFKEDSFCCHANDVEKKPSGDVIALVAHWKGISMYKSATILNDAFPEKQSSVRDAPKSNGNFDPFNYAENLDSSKEALEPFGVSSDLAENIGWMGVSKKGINKGKLVFPLRGEFGEFVAFVGVDAVKLPKEWRSQ